MKETKIKAREARETVCSPPGWPHCDDCDHAWCLHGVDGCLVKRCRCWRTDDSL